MPWGRRGWPSKPRTKIAEPILALAAADFSRDDGFADLAVLTEDRVVFHDGDAPGVPFSASAKHGSVFDEDAAAAQAFRAGNFLSTSEVDVVVALASGRLLTLPHPTHDVATAEGTALEATPISLRRRA